MSKRDAESKAPSTRALLMQTLAVATATVIFLFGSFVFLIDSQQQRAADDRIHDVVDEIGSMTTWAVGNWLNGRINQTVDAAEFYHYEANTDHPYGVFESPALQKTFLYSFIGTPDGQFKIWPMPDVDLSQFDPRNRPWYVGAVEQQGTFITTPYTSPTGELMLSVSVPLYTDGQLDAVVGTDFLVDEMTNLLNSKELGGLGYLFLVDDDGTIIAHPDKELLFKNIADVSSQDLNTDSAMREASFNGETRMMSFREIEGLPSANWHLGIAIDPNVAFKQVREFRIYAAAATIITLFFMVGVLGLVVDRLLAKPLGKARVQSEAANIAKSEFLANMSHEIRTPMNGVLGMAEILAGTNLDKRQSEYVATIERSGTALLSIINDILDLSKYEAGKLQFEAYSFDLQSAVDDVASLLVGTARDKNIELIVRYDPDLPRQVMGDMGRVRQIITNLCGNALKFTQEGFVLIDVTGKVEDGVLNAEVSIKDTGIGIAEEQLSQVFEAFTQAESSTTRRFGGTGLGLSISRRLARGMGGDIVATSVLGKGSTFKVTLPLPLATAEVRPHAGGADISGLKVLAVDDLTVNLQIQQEQLKKWGTHYKLVSSGAEALYSLREAVREGQPFDLVLLDYHMPEMDGLEVAEHIKTDPDLKRTRIVVLSSADRAEVAKGFRDLGVDAFLTKPARAVAIQHAIADAMSDRSISDLKAITQEWEKPVVVAATPAPSPATPTGMSVLVAEDNQVNRMVIETMLSDLNCTVDFAEDGSIAVAKYQNNSYDLVLMDVSMPNMDGVEATALIRDFEKSEKREALPIIALTAHAMAGDRERFLNAGMTDYMSKPVRQADLAACLERWGTGAWQKVKTA